MQIEHPVLALIHLLAFALVCGLLFALLLQPNRNQINAWFAAFCLSLGLAILSLLPVGSDTAMSILRWVATALAVITFLMFFTNYVREDNDRYRAERWRRLRLPAGLLVLGLVIEIISSLAGGSLAELHLESVLAVIGTTIIAAQIIRFQMAKPLIALSDDLRIANRDLRQSVSDLASERAKSDQLARELQAASQYKTEFLDNMGHKARTPLNSIVGYSELLQSGVYGDLTEKQQDRLQKIYRNGQALLDLINNMLDLSKIEAGRLEIHPTVFQLDTLIPQITQAVEGQRAEKNLELAANVTEGLMPLFGDERRILQVFTHLVGNALKFTQSGTVNLEAQNVKVERGVSSSFKLPLIGWLTDGDWVVFSVRDTGIGIPPEEQSKIFDEFYQVETPHTGEFTGTGLGLTISKKLVELHNGVIWVKSQPGEGSTFFVALRAYNKTAEGVDQRQTT
jgi:signal transduction histidine kinase